MISDAINSIINEQINKEFYSGYLYLSMSAYLRELGLFGFASWTKHQAKEEVEHGLKLFDYLIERNSYRTKDLHSTLYYAFIDSLLTVKPHPKEIPSKSINLLS